MKNAIKSTKKSGLVLTIPGSKVIAPFRYYKEAAQLYRRHVEARELEGLGGASNNAFGKITKDGEAFGYVSYNGRVWKGETHKGILLFCPGSGYTKEGVETEDRRVVDLKEMENIARQRAAFEIRRTGAYYCYFGEEPVVVRDLSGKLAEIEAEIVAGRAAAVERYRARVNAEPDNDDPEAVSHRTSEGRAWDAFERDENYARGCGL